MYSEHPGLHTCIKMYAGGFTGNTSHVVSPLVHNDTHWSKINWSFPFMPQISGAA